MIAGQEIHTWPRDTWSGRNEMVTRNGSVARALAVATLVSGATMIPMASAQAAAAKCGDNVTTYQSLPPVVQTLQRLTYINCTGQTLRRQADIAYAGDGTCKHIGPWATVSLARGVLKRWPIHIRGSKPC